MRALTCCLILAAGLPAAGRVTARGTVLDDATNQPVPNATVMVYSAGVKTGYDQFCPTCYVDCGKRAATAADGSFSIPNLSPDLVFQLLVIHEGHAAAFVKKVDPAGAPVEAVLKPRVAPSNPAQIVRGRVTNNKGVAVRDAVISQQGIIFEQGRGFGDRDWIDLVAVSNANGEFEMAYAKPAHSMILQVVPRGMAPKLVTLPTGARLHSITVTDGATIRGRLVRDGRPLANAEFALRSHSQGAGTTYQEVRMGTNERGEFAITNVPPGRVWDLYPTMDSLAPLGLAAKVTNVATKDDGHEVVVGDIQALPAHVVRGRIQLSDGKPIPPGMRVSIFADRLPDRQSVILPADGVFTFNGLAKGVYVLFATVVGYQPLDIEAPQEFLLEGDRSEFNVTLVPRPAK